MHTELDQLKIELASDEIRDDVDRAVEAHSFPEIRDACEFIDKLVADFKSG